jgi:hypothetical protein
LDFRQALVEREAYVQKSVHLEGPSN